MAAAEGTAGRMSVAQTVMAKNTGRCGSSEGLACTAAWTAKYTPTGISRLRIHLN